MSNLNPPRPTDQWLSENGKGFALTGECRAPGPEDWWVPTGGLLAMIGVGYGEVENEEGSDTGKFEKRRWILVTDETLSGKDLLDAAQLLDDCLIRIYPEEFASDQIEAAAQRFADHGGAISRIANMADRLRLMKPDWRSIMSRVNDSDYQEREPEPTAEDICGSMGHPYYGADNDGPRCYCGQRRTFEAAQARASQCNACLG